MICLGVVVERMLHNNKFFHHLISNEMFLDNAFDNDGSSGPIPDAFGIDQQDGAFSANSKTVSLGAENAGGPIGSRLIELEFD